MNTMDATSEMVLPSNCSSPSIAKSLLVIEPFYCGSHKQLVDLFVSSFGPSRVQLITMPGKKWPWRARASALWLSTVIPDVGPDVQTLFSSSVLNLAELVALRPDIRDIPRKVLYFHENQLIYPVRKSENQERDFQFGYNQILSCLVADKVIFNSFFNMNSFLDSINSYLNLMPDHRPKNLKEKIAPKCDVAYYPIDFNEARLQPSDRPSKDSSQPLHIVWPHRWEHDKDPETFFQTLYKLKDEGLSFHVSVVGEQYSQVPEFFDEAKKRLSSEVIQWGYLPSKGDYFELLKKADVVVSTAKHEFFGVAMLEAIHLGCYPIAPKNLVYVELYPAKHLFNTANQLYKMLKPFCKHPNIIRTSTVDIETAQFSWKILSKRFEELLFL